MPVISPFHTHLANDERGDALKPRDFSFPQLQTGREREDGRLGGVGEENEPEN